VRRIRLVERRFAAVLRKPLSVRRAASVIVSAFAVSVLVSGLLIRFLDPREFPTVGAGLWWALQTVTTVGYGDVVPQTPLGRFVAAFVMLQSIAFVSIITAAITSSFVERARLEQTSRTGPVSVSSDATTHLLTRLDELAARLDRIEQALRQRSS
jgi:voltage-gated potassium channel